MRSARSAGAGGRSPAAGRPAGRPVGRSGSRGSDAVDAVGGLVGPALADAGFDLEAVSVTRAGAQSVVSVAVDRDGGLDLDAVADASRVVSDVLDAGDAQEQLPVALRGAYTLEVSSRGATAPLTAPRHWRRAVGRVVEVRLRGRTDAQPRTVTGRILDADDTGAELAGERDQQRVDFQEVVRAVVQLEFRRPTDAADNDVRAEEETS